MVKMQEISKKVYQIVRRIPQGDVMTYGEIAKKAGIKNPRLVGRILHSNPNPNEIPCHRVVNFKGELSKNYAFGGIKAQARKLKAEGVEIENYRVVLPR